MSIQDFLASPASPLDADTLAALLRTTPAALAAFEAAYAKQALAADTGDADVFRTNSRQAAAAAHRIETPAAEYDRAALDDLIARIVAELLAQTRTYVFDGSRGREKRFPALPAATPAVTNEDIARVPAALRPELAGNLAKVDVGGDSASMLLYHYSEYLHNTDPALRKTHYGCFRQGLDILDLDALTYEILGTNRNSMGRWLPQLVDAWQAADDGFFRIPATTVARVPLPLLQLTRLDYETHTPTTLEIVDKWTKEAFRLDETKEYFIKTGIFSSKFDFRNCHVRGAKEVRELGEYLLYVHYQSVMMASPLTGPHPIYGAATTNEWVVREWIPDKENDPCIYKGLPLHTEYRVFVDCDDDAVLACVSYWEPETMKKRFRDGAGDGNVHDAHDYLIYKAHEPTLMRRYEENRDAVVMHVERLLPFLDLQGQYSLDIMQNGDDFWLIDMATAETSAFYDAVPRELRRPREEDWLPRLPVPEDCAGTENVI